MRAALSWWATPSIGMHIRRGDKGHRLSKSVATYVRVAIAIAETKQRACGGTPVDLFLASDSHEALQEARSRLARYSTLVTVRSAATNTTVTQELSGSSAEIATIGLRAAEEKKERLSDELLLDLMMLSRATVLVGLCMSQVMRVALSVGGAHGTLRYAVAVDPEHIAKVDPWKHGDAEGWQRDASNLDPRVVWSSCSQAPLNQERISNRMQ